MDFTQTTYKNLLETLSAKKYSFHTFQEYLHSHKQSSNNSVILLRHDVDRLPNNSLNLAILENSHGINGSYYFRVVPESYELDIMQKIANMGHEIGYHYEDVDLVIKNSGLTIKNENDREKLIDLAYESFSKNLEMLRKNFNIKTICMHGSPRAKYDNKIIWEKYSYKDLGILGEPYFDIDFNEFAYFTDTGRRWNGHKVSIRDKVDSKYKFDLKTTQEIIDNIDQLPNKIMFTIHPERWHDKPLPWMKELVLQNVKNVVKRGLLVVRG